MPVYFAQAGAGGPIKIGWAVDPTKRVSILQTAHHEKLSIIRVVEGDLKFEAALHRRFLRQRIRNEWFRFDDAMLADNPLVTPAPSFPADTRPFTAEQLCVLAEAYCEATGEPLSTLSDKVSDKTNHKLFGRLINGFGCTMENGERASRWFAENWPEGVAWPKAVPPPTERAA